MRPSGWGARGKGMGPAAEAAKPDCHPAQPGPRTSALATTSAPAGGDGDAGSSLEGPGNLALRGGVLRAAPRHLWRLS